MEKHPGLDSSFFVFLSGFSQSKSQCSSGACTAWLPCPHLVSGLGHHSGLGHQIQWYKRFPIYSSMNVRISSWSVCVDLVWWRVRAGVLASERTSLKQNDLLNDLFRHRYWCSSYFCPQLPALWNSLFRPHVCTRIRSFFLQHFLIWFVICFNCTERHTEISDVWGRFSSPSCIYRVNPQMILRGPQGTRQGPWGKSKAVSFHLFFTKSRNKLTDGRLGVNFPEGKYTKAVD